MIIGHVAPLPEPVVSITLVTPAGVEETVNAVIDTGYSGLLTLPPSLVQRLGFPLGPSISVMLAGNTPASYDSIEARLRWDDELRDVFALQTEGTPLIGMRLLKGYRLSIDVLDGGEVRIERLQP